MEQKRLSHLWQAGLQFSSSAPALSRYLLAQAISTPGVEDVTPLTQQLCAACCALLAAPGSHLRMTRKRLQATQAAASNTGSDSGVARRRIARQGRRGGKHLRVVCQACGTLNVKAVDSRPPARAKQAAAEAATPGKPLAAATASPAVRSLQSSAVNTPRGSASASPVPATTAAAAAAASGSASRTPASCSTPHAGSGGASASGKASAAASPAFSSASKNKKPKKGTLKGSLLNAVKRTTTVAQEDQPVGLEAFLSMLG